MVYNVLKYFWHKNIQLNVFEGMVKLGKDHKKIIVFVVFYNKKNNLTKALCCLFKHESMDYIKA